ncbi:MAG: hypothetical protein HYZ28_13580 [Myxococcales bacterium]|nr:hypothetical protein [Myxococcales bacterium]
MRPHLAPALFALGGLLAGGGAGGAAAWALSQRLIKGSGEPRGWRPVEVVVATADIPSGGSFWAELLARKTAPEQHVQTSSVRPADARHLIGAHALVPVARGEMLRWYAVAEAYPSGACEVLRGLAAGPELAAEPRP